MCAGGEEWRLVYFRACGVQRECSECVGAFATYSVCFVCVQCVEERDGREVT